MSCLSCGRVLSKVQSSPTLPRSTFCKAGWSPHHQVPGGPLGTARRSPRGAAARGRRVEVLGLAPSMAQTLDTRAELLSPARRGLRPTRRACLHVGAQALKRFGGSCARAAPRQAGVRPIQRLDSGPPAPLSQPHGGCRSCARRSQSREAEAADSARGPRGVVSARETGRGGGAARRASSSERSVVSLTAPLPLACAYNRSCSSSSGAMHETASQMQQISSCRRAQGGSNVDIVGGGVAGLRMAKPHRSNIAGRSRLL